MPEENAPVSQAPLVDVTKDGWEAINGWFGLTYSAYLTLPRAMMEQMPNRWQIAMVALLEEMEETLDYEALYPEGMQFMVKRRGPGGTFLPDPLTNYRHPPHIPIKKRPTNV